MNEALGKLYDDLLSHVDDATPEEEITEAERAKRFLEEKRVAIGKLKEISLKRLDEDERRKEEARLRELDRKRQEAIDMRIQKEAQEKNMIRDMEEKTIRFWKKDIAGKRQHTGVLYFGESKRCGDAWVPHGHGEYRVNGETIYDGTFCDGAMHGEGRLLFDTGELWAGHFWKDTVSGIGTLIAVDNTKRRAIYWRDRRVCFLDELVIGCRLQLLGDDYVRNAGGEAMLVAVTGRLGRYLLRLDGGKEKLIRLDSERFRLLRHKPQTITLDSVVGSLSYKNLYDYKDDQANPKTSAHRENFYWPDLWAAREKAEQERQAELTLEMERAQILACRQIERDAKSAADQSADVAKGLDEERQRREGMEIEKAKADERDKAELEAGGAATEAKKRMKHDLSRSPPHHRLR